MTDYPHTPVLLNETLDLLNLKAGQHVIDCTLGLGGHSFEILQKIGKTGKLMVFEQDERNLEKAKARLKDYEGQVIYVHKNFENLAKSAKEHDFSPDAILFDLGLSSPHVDDADRGFSFKNDGPLDMRYDQRQELTAEIVINSYKEDDIANILFEYGEERRSRPIARMIVIERKKERITSTARLAEIVAKTFRGKQKTHPATKTFQALRIYVNRELNVLENTLEQAINTAKIGGRIAVISYHSLEDRIVKNRFKYYTKTCICPQEIPICQCDFQKKLYILTKKPIIPLGIEVQSNPRARSAKLRVAERI